MRAAGVQSNESQRGAVLIISLLILVVLTVLGISAMSSTSIEERMSLNLRDREVAFQAAEATLRQAERYIEANKFSMAFSNNCSDGFCDCSDETTGCAEYWSDTTLDVWNNANRYRLYTVNLNGVSAAGKYIIEHLGKQIIPPDVAPCASCPDMYRITARANGLTDKSVVMLQVTYRINP